MCCRSQRCRQCEHNLSKPEYNPTSIKFKIQLAAFYHVPEVIIFQLSREPLRPGQDTTFVLKVTNPSGHPTSFQLLSLEDEEEMTADNSVTTAALTADEGDTNKNMSVSTVMKQLSLVKASNSHKVKVNAAFLAVKEGGSSRTYLPPRDDTVKIHTY